MTECSPETEQLQAIEMPYLSPLREFVQNYYQQTVLHEDDKRNKLNDDLFLQPLVTSYRLVASESSTAVRIEALGHWMQRACLTSELSLTGVLFV